MSEICPIDARDVIVEWENCLGGSVCFGRLPFLVSSTVLHNRPNRHRLFGINCHGKKDETTLAIGDRLTIVRGGLTFLIIVEHEEEP